jgi:hypothetical protein
MERATSRERKILAGPPCEKCGGTTRIVAIAPHKRFKRRHVWTLECMSCGTAQRADVAAPHRTH